MRVTILVWGIKNELLEVFREFSLLLEPHFSWGEEKGTRSESKGSLALVTKVVLPRGRIHLGMRSSKSIQRRAPPPTSPLSYAGVRQCLGTRTVFDTMRNRTFCPAVFSLRLLPNPETHRMALRICLYIYYMGSCLYGTTISNLQVLHTGTSLPERWDYGTKQEFSPKPREALKFLVLPAEADLCIPNDGGKPG